MMKSIFLLSLLTACTLAATSCSKDDTPGDPEGTVALNMLDEQNGKTMLENSGIYINQGLNFVCGSACNLYTVGKTSGLGAVRINSLLNPVAQAAVQPGHGYVAVRPAALLSFPSGALAMPIGNSEVNYMKFYVVSPISKEGKTVGAAIKFAFVTPATYGLPAFGSTALTIGLDTYEQLGKEVALQLPTSDFEYDFHNDESVHCEKRGSKLFFSLSDWSTHECTLFLRIRESYTRVYVKVGY